MHFIHKIFTNIQRICLYLPGLAYETLDIHIGGRSRPRRPERGSHPSLSDRQRPPRPHRRPVPQGRNCVTCISIISIPKDLRRTVPRSTKASFSTRVSSWARTCGKASRKAMPTISPRTCSSRRRCTAAARSRAMSRWCRYPSLWTGSSPSAPPWIARSQPWRWPA